MAEPDNYRPIVAYHRDESGDWVATVSCGHFQHVRHDPPWTNRVWVTTAEGRESMKGFPLPCTKCDENIPPDVLPKTGQAGE